MRVLLLLLEIHVRRHTRRDRGDFTRVNEYLVRKNVYLRDICELRSVYSFYTQGIVYIA